MLTDHFYSRFQRDVGDVCAVVRSVSANGSYFWYVVTAKCSAGNAPFLPKPETILDPVFRTTQTISEDTQITIELFY